MFHEINVIYTIWPKQPLSHFSLKWTLPWNVMTGIPSKNARSFFLSVFFHFIFFVSLIISLSQLLSNSLFVSMVCANFALLTGWSALLIPTRNSDSAMNRLMQRFLWMVLRSLCSPLKKQKVKMHISRQTSDNRIPTHVMTSRSMSCMLPVFCEEETKKKIIQEHFSAQQPWLCLTLVCWKHTSHELVRRNPFHFLPPWLMWVLLCVAERSGPQCYAALHRCASSIHQCPASWQAEQCST